MQDVDINRVMTSALNTESYALFTTRKYLWNWHRDIHLRFCACAEGDIGQILQESARFQEELAEHARRTEEHKEMRAKMRARLPRADLERRIGQ